MLCCLRLLNSNLKQCCLWLLQFLLLLGLVSLFCIFFSFLFFLNCFHCTLGIKIISYISHMVTLFWWIRWKFFPYMRRPLSKLRHSSSDQRLMLSIGGAICMRWRLNASSTLWPHCSNMYNAWRKWEEDFEFNEQRRHFVFSKRILEWLEFSCQKKSWNGWKFTVKKNLKWIEISCQKILKWLEISRQKKLKWMEISCQKNWNGWEFPVKISCFGWKFPANALLYRKRWISWRTESLNEEIKRSYFTEMYLSGSLNPDFLSHPENDSDVAERIHYTLQDASSFLNARDNKHLPLKHLPSQSLSRWDRQRTLW